MFPRINTVKKLERDLAEEMVESEVDVAADAELGFGISALLRRFGSTIDDDHRATPVRSTRSDWSPLIDRIRATAHHLREIDAHARARDEQMDELLQRVRQDMAMAEARVRLAEARIDDARIQAAEQVQAAEARAAMAEERARVSEEWLMRIQEIIQTEFSGLSEAID